MVAGEGSRAVTTATIARLLKPGVDFRTFGENLATLTLGSMAVAAMLVHERHSAHGHRLLGGTSRAATQHSRLCLGTPTEMKTDATTLLKEGVALADATSRGCWPSSIWAATIRASSSCTRWARPTTTPSSSASACRPTGRCGCTPDHGNVGAAGVPFTLATAVERGRVSAGMSRC